jgi:hypothetical protein
MRVGIRDKLIVCWTDWAQEEAEVPGDNTHLWEESWDDDDTSEDFSAQLKYLTIPPLPLCYTWLIQFQGGAKESRSKQEALMNPRAGG